MYRNQKGLTLIELLGAMTLLFIISGLVITTLSNGSQFFQRENKRIDVRQEANTIANQLQTFFQQNGNFEIIQEGDGVKIESVREDDDGNEIVEVRAHSIPGHKITIPDPVRGDDDRFDRKFIDIIVIGDEDFSLNTAVSRLREG